MDYGSGKGVRNEQHESLTWHVYLLSDANIGRYGKIWLNSTAEVVDQWQRVANRRIVGPFASNTRVEVYHEWDDCRHAHCAGGPKAECDVGYWAHLAPGSGVFLNLGKTIVTDGGGYGHGCKALVGKDDPACNQCCTPNHVALVQAAVAQRYDSLQSCCQTRGGSAPEKYYEIVFFKSTCAGARSDPMVGACPRALSLSAGRAFPKPCACDPGLAPTTRCRHEHV